MSNARRRRPPGARFAWLLTASVCLPHAEAQLLLGGPPPVPPPEVRIDPRLPTGAARTFSDRPVTEEPPACSFTRPVCVHRLGDIPGKTALTVLEALETAYDRLVVALDLPAPRPDSSRGGSDALDLYLDPAAGSDLEVLLDPPRWLGFDTASVFCRGGRYLEPARAATLCVAEAIAARLDAGTTPDIRRAYATHLWWATGEPDSTDLARVDDAQRHPERSLFGRERTPASEGAGALFFDVLDFTRGRGAPGTLATMALAAAGSRTAPSAPAWNNEPDLLDVLRHTFEPPAAFASLFGDFAVTRAFLGDRDDGTHAPQLAWTGSAGDVRFDWSLKYSALPRRVASAYPIEPFGATYLWLDLDDRALGAKLGFQAQWEPPVSFQWMLVRMARDGRELSRLVVPFLQRATEVTQTLDNLDAAAGVLIVGTQFGGVDLLHPFDPDVAPFEGHGCTVYLAKL